MRGLLFFSLILLAATMLTGCGVKGDPLPPKDAPRLGRGGPTYTNAVESIGFDSQKIENEEGGDDEDQ